MQSAAPDLTLHRLRARHTHDTRTQGWVGEGDEEAPVDFFQNLLSGGKLQREADEQRERRRREAED